MSTDVVENVTFLDEHVAPSDSLLEFVLCPVVLGQEVTVTSAHVLEALLCGATSRARMAGARELLLPSVAEEVR